MRKKYERFRRRYRWDLLAMRFNFLQWLVIFMAAPWIFAAVLILVS